MTGYFVRARLRKYAGVKKQIVIPADQHATEIKSFLGVDVSIDAFRREPAETESVLSNGQWVSGTQNKQ
jgi:hypothetical protein